METETFYTAFNELWVTEVKEDLELKNNNVETPLYHMYCKKL
jgi:hypothetical protein